MAEKTKLHESGEAQPLIELTEAEAAGVQGGLIVIEQVSPPPVPKPPLIPPRDPSLSPEQKAKIR